MIVEIPRYIKQHNQNITLYIDLMYICTQGFLTCVDSPITYRLVQHGVKKKGTNFAEACEKITQRYNNAGYTVGLIRIDREFEHLQREIARLTGAEVNFENSYDHQRVAERNNRTIQERFRCTSHGIPFERLPPTPIVEGTHRVTEALNLIPTIKQKYSPYNMLHHRKPNFRFWKYPFGCYV